MNKHVSFELFLFGDEKETAINDVEFIVDRIILFPQIRPHDLEKAEMISDKYCQFPDFRRKLLEKSNKCPVLIYRLFRKGIFVFEEIKPLLMNKGTFILSYYFRKEIHCFSKFIENKEKPDDFDESFFENDNEIDQMIEYGFISTSIEYCLKYDAIDDFKTIDISDQEAEWSPFEWSIEPKYLDLLSFSGFFGSIKCFKHLLMKGYEINEKVQSMVICSGCFDLFHLCQPKNVFTTENIIKATEFCHLSLIDFMIESGVEINSVDEFVHIVCLKILLFMRPLFMAI